MPVLNDKEREFVAIGAAIGAGCRPCTRYHVKAAVKAGISEDDVRLAVRDAEVVRIEVVTSIAEYANRLLGRGRRDGERLCSPAEPSQALTQIGAATGGNAGYLLDSLLVRARGLGLTSEALGEAVGIATKVKGVAASFYEKDAERALGRATEVTRGEEGECVGSQPCGASEPVGATAQSCC